VLRDPQGAPRWPDGVVGSITHCPGYRAAAVAPARTVALLGIDAEPDEPLPPDVAASVSGVAERAALHRWALPDRLVFCAKEAVYKAWAPATGDWLDFSDVRIAPSPDGTLSATVTRGLGGVLTGRWLSRDGLLLVVVTGCADVDVLRNRTA
jgi:4'-phosphopantetheinyl transferase EntD